MPGDLASFSQTPLSWSEHCLAPCSGQALHTLDPEFMQLNSLNSLSLDPPTWQILLKCFTANYKGPICKKDDTLIIPNSLSTGTSSVPAQVKY